MGGITEYEYNGLGQVVRTTDPIGQMSFNSYDLAGRLVSTMDRNGNVIQYELDEMGRVVQVQTDSGCACSRVRFTYDQAGQVVTMVDSTGVTHYRYDANGRLIEEQTPISTIWYEYDALGLRTATRLPEGAVLYSYNRANQLVAQTDLSGGQTTYTYGPDGEVYQIRRIPYEAVEMIE